MNENVNQNLKFTPMGANHGNVDGNIAHLRDTFLNAEMEYFSALLEYSENVDYLLGLLDYPPDELYNEAIKRINLVESGMVQEKDLDMKEAEITFLLAAIQDKEKILELIKTMDISTEMSSAKNR